MARLFLESASQGRYPLVDLTRTDLADYGLYLPPGVQVRSPLRPGRRTDFQNFIRKAEEIIIPPNQPLVINTYPRGINWIVADPFVGKLLEWWVGGTSKKGPVYVENIGGTSVYVDGSIQPVDRPYVYPRGEKRPIRTLQNAAVVSATVLGLDLVKANMNMSTLFRFARGGSKSQPWV